MKTPFQGLSQDEPKFKLATPVEGQNRLAIESRFILSFAPRRRGVCSIVSHSWQRLWDWFALDAAGFGFLLETELGLPQKENPP